MISSDKNKVYISYALSLEHQLNTLQIAAEDLVERIAIHSLSPYRIKELQQELYNIHKQMFKIEGKISRYKREFPKLKD